MGKKVIIFFIILVTIALVGLMAIQVHWIKNAITVKEAGFIRSVDLAMSDVVFQLEKMEMARQLQDRSLYNDWIGSSLRQMDSLNRLLFENFSQISDYSDFEKFFRKSVIAQNILQEWAHFRPPPPISQRLRINILDSLISAELRKKGVETPFEYGVYLPSQNRLISQKTGKFPNQLLTKSFAFTLFPGDVQPSHAYLMIYFPKERRFLLSQLWGMLSVSVLLILIIIFSFTITIHTIFRQKKLSEMKTDFINNMTHEFKTPVSTISLACEALADKDVIKSEEMYHNYINVINEENKRLGVIAEKVLQSAKIDKGQISLRKEWVNIHEMIHDVVKRSELQVGKRNGRIMTDLRAETTVLLADRMHISNVIFNLVDNAIKYTIKDPEILISTANTDHGIVVSVRDNGVGISKANQQKIFEKLYRVPTGNIHNFKGFGLGLSYAKAIVTEHNGRIELESDLKTGSVFKVFLPLEDYKTKKRDEG